MDLCPCFHFVAKKNEIWYNKQGDNMIEANGVIKQIAQNCLGCKHALCQKQCPFHLPINEILNFVKNNEFEKAADLIFSFNLFPFVTGSLCDVNRKCKGACVLNKNKTPISFNEVETFLGVNYYKKVLYKNDKIKPYRVAIIGGGIGGLSAALTLIHEGIIPDIYEKNDYLGGVITSSLPAFRWKYQEIFDEYLTFIKENANIHYNSIFGGNLFYNDLESFDAIALAYGASIPRQVLDENVVYQAIDLLENKEKREKINNQKVIVLGCGNVAIDIARTMRRLDNDVEIVYRRNIASSPASILEIKEATDEGVTFKECLSPVTIKSINGNVINLLCEKMNLVSDGSSRLNFVKTGLYECLSANIIIEALGNNVDYKYLKQKFSTIFNEKGYIDVDEFYQTKQKNLYLIGDAYTGPNDFASAINSGIVASHNIIKNFTNNFAKVEDLICKKNVAFGGSFNPPTIAHLAIINYLEKFNPSKIIMIPNGDKYNVSFVNKTLIGFKDRKLLCEQLIADSEYNNIEVSCVENNHPFMGTVHTLKELNHPTFIMGSDCLETLSKWVDYENLVKDNNFIIFTRELSKEAVKNYILNDAFLSKYISHFAIIDIEYGNVSSSNFRNTLDLTLLTPKVAEYINNHNLYEVKNVTK